MSSSSSSSSSEELSEETCWCCSSCPSSTSFSISSSCLKCGGSSNKSKTVPLPSKSAGITQFDCLVNGLKKKCLPSEVQTITQGVPVTDSFAIGFARFSTGVSSIFL